MFHVLHDGETPRGPKAGFPTASEFDAGFLVGLLVGEGHFGGDGKQPHVTLRMHVRHSALFSWIERTFPGGRLYGPYTHDGRHYFQWMARGAFLRDQLLPFIDQRLSADLDTHSRERLDQMKTRYGQSLGLSVTRGDGESAIQSTGPVSPPTSSERPPFDATGGHRKREREPVPARLERIFSQLRTTDDLEGSSEARSNDSDPS